MGKHILTLHFENTFTSLSSVTVEMTDEEYKKYLCYSTPLDSIVKKSKNVEDFIKRTKSHDNPQFKVLKYHDDKDHLIQERFELEYTNEIEE